MKRGKTIGLETFRRINSLETEIELTRRVRLLCILAVYFPEEKKMNKKSVCDKVVCLSKKKKKK